MSSEYIDFNTKGYLAYQDGKGRYEYPYELTDYQEDAWHEGYDSAEREDPKNQQWIYDERPGCVAVYRGPQRECLSAPREAFLFYRHGKYGEDAGGFRGWTVDPEDIAEAKLIYQYLTGKVPTA